MISAGSLLTHESVGDACVPLGCAGDVQGDSAEVERRHDVEALEAAAHGAQHGRRVVDDETAVAAVPGDAEVLIYTIWMPPWFF